MRTVWIIGPKLARRAAVTQSQLCRSAQRISPVSLLRCQISPKHRAWCVLVRAPKNIALLMRPVGLKKFQIVSLAIHELSRALDTIGPRWFERRQRRREQRKQKVGRDRGRERVKRKKVERTKEILTRENFITTRKS